MKKRLLLVALLAGLFAAGAMAEESTKDQIKSGAKEAQNRGQNTVFSNIRKNCYLTPILQGRYPVGVKGDGGI